VTSPLRDIFLTLSSIGGGASTSVVGGVVKGVEVNELNKESTLALLAFTTPGGLKSLTIVILSPGEAGLMTSADMSTFSSVSSYSLSFEDRISEFESSSESALTVSVLLDSGEVSFLASLVTLATSLEVLFFSETGWEVAMKFMAKSYKKTLFLWLEVSSWSKRETVIVQPFYASSWVTLLLSSLRVKVLSAFSVRLTQLQGMSSVPLKVILMG